MASFAVPTPPRGALPVKDMIPAQAAQASVTIPPYETPVYTPPPADSIALGSLLEASGYSGAATGNSKSMAAGNFCGDAQKEIFVVTNSVKAAGRPPHP